MKPAIQLEELDPASKAAWTTNGEQSQKAILCVSKKLMPNEELTS